MRITKRIFVEIYNEYFDDIRRYIYYRSGDEQLAADIAQDTFVKLYQNKKLKKEHIKSLLYKIANQSFLDYLRRKKVSTDYLEHIRLSFKSSHDISNLNLNELKIAYEKALSTMPEKDRIVFLMSRMEDKKYREIAESIDVSIKTVEKRMSSALKYLKKELKEFA